jgi:hypothetical protein
LSVVWAPATGYTVRDASAMLHSLVTPLAVFLGTGGLCHPLGKALRKKSDSWSLMIVTSGLA